MFSSILEDTIKKCTFVKTNPELLDVLSIDFNDDLNVGIVCKYLKDDKCMFEFVNDGLGNIFCVRGFLIK